MQRANRHLEQKAVDYCDIQPNDNVLEVGFGGGDGLLFAAEKVKGMVSFNAHYFNLHPTFIRFIEGNGRVHGIDLSRMCVERVSKKYKRLIKNAKLDVSFGTVTNLPYKSDMFNCAFHVNSFFFWDNMPLACSELFRVLKPGSKLITAVDIQHYSQLKKKNLIPSMSVDPINYMFCLEASGFTDVNVEYLAHKGLEFPVISAIAQPDLDIDFNR